MIYVYVNTKDELKDVHDAWSKKYHELDRWSNSVISGISTPTVLGLVIPEESKYYRNVFYTGYGKNKDTISFDEFRKKYIYKPSKYVKQLKFESLMTEAYIYENKSEYGDFRIIYDKMKENMFNFKIHSNGIELIKISYTPGNVDSFSNNYYNLYKSNYNDLLGIFLEARRKNGNKKIIFVEPIMWLKSIMKLIEDANNTKLSSSKYVKQLKFESFKDFIKEN